MGFVIGTAGHIDHGKSTLVEALTGTNPDRLDEERRRGITIELGFAQLDLGEGLTASFVDVPGHEALVRTMVAGATGIDGVMLVVAADEGVMPQTREHLDILELLGLEQGVVALSKVDRVDEELIELATLELSEILADTALADAPIVAVSGVSGQGVEELRAALRNLLTQGSSQTDAADAQRGFRLPIDRLFSKRGFGTVVTGSGRGGSVRKGEELELVPGGLRVKVRGLQMHGRSVDEAGGSNRIAINLQGVDKDALERGAILATPGTLAATSMLQVRARLLPTARPIETGSEIRVLSGTAETAGRIYWIGDDGEPPKEMGAGASAWAQLRLSEPMALDALERIILRRTAPDRTVGGARVLDTVPRKFRKRDVEEHRALLSALEREEGLDGRLQALTRAQRGGVLRASEAALRLGVTVSALEEVASDELVRLPGELRWAHRDFLRSLARRARAVLAELHAEQPLRAGFSAEELKGRVGAPPALLSAALEELVATSDDVEQGDFGLRVAGHRVELDADQQAAIERLLSSLREKGLDPPDPAKVLGERGDALQLMAFLVDAGRIVRVNRNYVLDARVHEDLLRKVRVHLETQGSMDPIAFKDLTGLSRKHAIPLLEHLDAIGLTRRQGNLRVLR
jgi:selenocysteine-specific elongation factor